MLKLIDVAKSKGDVDAIQPYWNTYHCLEKLYTHDGRAYGKYCKNRFCTLCAGIRKADLINRYMPTLMKWPEPYFVTLTAKAIGANNLNSRMKKMKKAFVIILTRNKKRAQRGKEIRLIGVKSLECNFNPKRRTYNPHYHLIVPNKVTAELLIKYWLELFTIRFASPKAQDARKITNLETALVEVVKYSSKIFTEPQESKSNKKPNHMIYVRALHNIIMAMKNIRIFDRFGLNISHHLKHNIKIVSRYQEWSFDQDYQNWRDINTNEILLDQIPCFSSLSFDSALDIRHE